MKSSSAASRVTSSITLRWRELGLRCDSAASTCGLLPSVLRGVQQTQHAVRSFHSHNGSWGRKMGESQSWRTARPAPMISLGSSSRGINSSFSDPMWRRPRSQAALPKVDGGCWVPGFFLIADWVEDSHGHKPPVHAHVQDIRPDRPTCYVLHGILGTGKNWVPFVRKFAENFPNWQFLLLDLRGHGDSSEPPGEHTLKSTARDVEMLARATGRAPDIVIGHSFGGKVAMEYMQLASVTPQMTWVLDSWLEKMELNSMFRHDKAHDKVHWNHDYEQPSTMTDVQPGASSNIMSTLESITLPIASRSSVSEILIEQGYSKETATWMVSNLVRAPPPPDELENAEGPDASASASGVTNGAGNLKKKKARKKSPGLEWRFNLGIAKQLITSAAATDSVPLLLNARGQVGFVRAGQGLRWTPASLHRLERVLLLPNVAGHCIMHSGHWLHVQAPADLTRILAPSFHAVHLRL